MSCAPPKSLSALTSGVEDVKELNGVKAIRVLRPESKKGVDSLLEFRGVGFRSLRLREIMRVLLESLLFVCFRVFPAGS